MKRLFLACTPRTGNTWARKMLAEALGILETAAHSPAEFDWSALPPECIAAMHWRRTPEMERILEGYQILVTARHPLDVLISILHFSQRVPATARWLEGEGGNENILKGAAPTDEKFVEYALSDRAAALLSVSVEWKEAARAVIHYEEMIEQPRRTLIQVLEAIGETVPANLDQVIEAHRMRAYNPNNFWRGQPGLWRDLIVEEHRRAIYDRHREVFRTFGYNIDGAPAPSLEAARRSWIALEEQPSAGRIATVSG